MNYKKWDILALYKTGKTVWAINDLAIFWKAGDRDLLKSAVAYYIKSGAVISLQKGVYGLSENYDVLELATKIYTPAYISFETVLRKEGVIFQHYDKIFVASLESRNKIVSGKKFVFRKLKKSILYNKLGIISNKFYYIASKERAILDLMYLRKRVFFDNLRSVDWKKVFEILKIYENKSLEKRVEILFNKFKKSDIN